MLEVVAWALGVVERRRTFEIRPVDLGPVHADVSSLVARDSGPHSECQMKKRCQRGHTLHPGSNRCSNTRERGWLLAQLGR